MDKHIAAADLSNIEGRVLAYLAGEEWKLEAFRAYDEGEGPDLYNITATSIIGGDPYKVEKKNRNVFGKVPDLALGYEGGVGALQTFATAYGVAMLDHWDTIQANIDPQHIASAKGNYATWGAEKAKDMEIEEDEWIASETVKLAWRARHPATKQLWYDTKDAAIAAIRSPGKVFEAGPFLKFSVRAKAGIRYLLIKLPSGRFLVYCRPKLEGEDRDIKISYEGSFRRTPTSPPIWGRVHTYGGKLIENCIAAGTEVLTARGWVPIENVWHDDKIHDGVEFVTHGGLLFKSVQNCVSIDGVYMTPDHEVLTDDGWQAASQHPRPYRPAIRFTDRSTPVAHEREEMAVGVPVRLWHRVHQSWCRCVQRIKAWRNAELRVQNNGAPVEAKDTRHVEAPGVCCVEVDAGQVPLTVAPGVEKLRRAGDTCVLPLVRVFRELLARYGADVSEGVNPGQDKQRRGVFAEELPLGVGEHAGQQQTGEPTHPYPVGGDDGQPSSAAQRDRAHHDPLSDSCGVACGPALAEATPLEPREVYDIADCGPRHRFVVRGDNGPFIVHNCCQALARDVLAYNMPAAEAAGYAITLTVHDEIISESEKDETELSAIMATVPPWAEGLPLAAAGFTATRYRKD